MSASVNNRGSIWFDDGSGQVFKGTLVDYDTSRGVYWVHSFKACSEVVDIVVILKDGGVFESGNSEWCGQARLMGTETLPDARDAAHILCLEAIV